MPDKELVPIRLEDYRPTPFLIETVDLVFELDPARTCVTARSKFVRNPNSQNESSSLVLDGENLTFRSLKLNDEVVPADRIDVGEQHLKIKGVPNTFDLEVITEISPQDNTALEGLYLSSGRFCTQCEAEGFRRITYFLDRPDVLSRYRVEIQSDKDLYPVLLSNGNCVDKGETADGDHYSVWEDPFPKPCYLFALVAGALSKVSDRFVTKSGLPVSLNLYVEAGKEDRARYALESLSRAMTWDEQVYGLEYDLSEFNIVAVSDFNMGAMENKSLNIFNDKFILADPKTATDTDFAWIESIVAHEYFHNWTGNRVTCRDWFQLSLKEGLTVFRDQQFSADMRSPGVKRIEDVQALRSTQFPEDAGPLAHPVRPNQYVEINNFYTHTVYEKGAEVVRMLHTILGAEAFRRGMDLYIERHDGQAVTCEDFVAAMADASQTSLEQFLFWYRQVGTPIVVASGSFDSESGIYTLCLRQKLGAKREGLNQTPLVIPLKLGFTDTGDEELKTVLVGSTNQHHSTHTLSFDEIESVYEFHGFPDTGKQPVISLNRGFSSPVIIEMERTPSELGLLIAKDTDPFVRWDSAQVLAGQILHKKMRGETYEYLIEHYLQSIGMVLNETNVNYAESALLLSLPSEAILAEQMEIIDPDAIYNSRLWLKEIIAQEYGKTFQTLYESIEIKHGYRPNAEDSAKRSLKNRALEYVVHYKTSEGRDMAFSHCTNADNMTDRWAALCVLNQLECRQREEALSSFMKDFYDDALVLDKCFMLEANSPLEGTLGRVKALLSHPRYEAKNPNRIRALIGTFARNNAVGFHDSGGQGYAFIAEQILTIDRFNPQVAARLASAFQNWSRYDENRKNYMRNELERIRRDSSLSPDVSEIVRKSLQSDI